MIRSRRSFAWSLVLALLCASFVAAQQTPTVALAVGLPCPAGESCIVVTSAADPFNDVYPPAANPQPDYRCDATTTDGCTLREAITLANAAAAGTKTRIQFSVPRGSAGYATRFYLGQTVETWTIRLIAPLPGIEHDNTNIDGFSQEQFTVGISNGFGPTIVIDGGPLTNGTTTFPPQGTGGLLVHSSNNVIQGLGIINFKTSGSGGSTLLGIGIEIAPNTNPVNSAIGNIIRGCYLGVDEIGQNAAPNSYGMWVQTNGNTIGGSNALSSQDPNIVSGNFNDGILITGGNNLVRGNYVGLNRDGNVAIGNRESGVNMRTSSGNIVGTPSTPLDSTFGNIISGNGQNGVFLSNGSNNIINGNLIGTDGTGGFAIGNAVDGIRIESSTSPTSNNKIGEKDFFNRNIISGNGGAGIHLAGFKTKDNVVLNNFIGPSAGGVGLTGLSNRNGIIIDNGADSTTVGGALLGNFLSLAADNEANLISGNISDGVVISGTVSQDNKLFGNTIGLDESRGFLFGNGGRGIVVLNGPQTVTIGGAGTLGNVISANGGGGIAILGKPSAPITDVLILGNIIGLRRDPAARPYNASVPINFAAGNNGDGVYVNNADKVRVGGTVAEANTIAKNIGNGIFSTGTNFTIIQNNSIGGLKIGPTTYKNLGNTGNGIRVTGTLTATANLVVYNGLNGVWVTGGAKSPLTTNTVNFNGMNGFLIDGSAADVQIIGSTIYSNTLNGVFVQGGVDNPQQVKIFDNSMTGNAITGNKKGIVLTPGTTPGSIVTSPNHDIDPPYLLHIDQTGKLSGKIRITPNNPAIGACAQPCVIQLFTTNPQTLDTQGRDKLNATVTIVPDSLDPSVGNFSAAVGSVPAQLALTATDKNGNTSEFAVFTSTFGLDIQPPRSSSAYPGDVVVYTHRITNTGTVDFTNIQFSAFSKLGWPFKLAPANPISLLSGASKPVTLTLTLPTGADPRVRIPNTELTRLTVSATTANPALVTTKSITDTTIVGARFQLDASFKLPGRNGSGAPGTIIDYTRTLTNTGNVTGTVTLTATTDLGWTTLITPTSVTLPPGKVIGVVSSVAIPLGTIAGTVAKTKLTLDGSQVGLPLVDKQQLLITDTTTVLLTPKATMVFNQQAQGSAGKTVVFCHTVTNLSNGAATFTLTGVSSLGSKISFVSDTPGRQLVNGNTFTVGITNADKSFSFCARVLIEPRAAKGQQDLVAIGMTDAQGAVVGGASVRDLIDVVAGLMLPRIYVPLIRR